MKIVYSAGNRLGAGHQLNGFLEQTSHDVRVASYLESGRLLHFVDWTLDTNTSSNLENLRNDITHFEPDLILIDGEPIVANIGQSLSIPIVYCSPLHLLDGVPWERGQLSYSAPLEILRTMLAAFPVGVKRLVYSPVGDIERSPSLREGFEWVRPYHFFVDGNSEVDQIMVVVEDSQRFDAIVAATQGLKLNFQYFRKLDAVYEKALENCAYIFSTGETKHIADAVYNNKSFCLLPNLKDPETVMNAIACSAFGLGLELGQLELMGKFSTSKIEESISKKINYTVTSQHKMLHERIDELWECM